MSELNNVWRDVQRGPPDPFLVGDEHGHAVFGSRDAVACKPSTLYSETVKQARKTTIKKAVVLTLTASLFSCC